MVARQGDPTLFGRNWQRGRSRTSEKRDPVIGAIFFGNLFRPKILRFHNAFTTRIALLLASRSKQYYPASRIANSRDAQARRRLLSRRQHIQTLLAWLIFSGFPLTAP